MATFGKRAAERAAERAQQEYYVKTFQDKRTDIRFLWDDPRNNFVEIREHFDKPNKMSYPCAKFEDAAGCIGCDYPVEHPEWADLDEYFPDMKTNDARDERKKQDPGWATRDTSSKWLFPAIDPKGYVSVYKIGWNFWNSLCELYDLMGTITDKDYAVIKGGETWNTTSYQAQAISQPYERQAKVTPPTPEGISSVLGGKYVYAMEKYGMDTSGMQDAPVPTPVEEAGGDDPAPVTTPAPAATPRPGSNQPAAVPRGAQDPANLLPPAQHTEPAKPGDVVSESLAAHQNARADAGLPGPDPTPPASSAGPVDDDGVPLLTLEDGTPFAPREAERGEICDWLKRAGVEYSARAPRTVLVKLAETRITELSRGWPEPKF